MSEQFNFVSEKVKKELLENQLREMSSMQVDGEVSSISEDQWVNQVHNWLRVMVSKKGSDMFITSGIEPSMKLFGEIVTLEGTKKLSEQDTLSMVNAIMNERQRMIYKEQKSCNFAISLEGAGRFRVNAFTQKGRAAMVMRTINTKIPELESLGVPEILKSIIMKKRGLIIVVGATGSGKSTTLAAMLGYHNQNRRSHIITIEDPIEFVHEHNKSLITQREVGVDTPSWEAAIEDALREAPDVILIGEVRNRETMQHAIDFSETGHLCLCTLHANNANQALDRIVNFFPEEKKHQLLMDLSLNLNSIVSQRLIPNPERGRVPAVEILMKTAFVSDLIFKGDVSGIKEAMKNGREHGMQTFDQALFNLYEEKLISYDDALRNADNMNDLKLEISTHSKRDQGKQDKGPISFEFK